MRKESLQDIIDQWQKSSQGLKDEVLEKQKEQPDEPNSLSIGMRIGIDKCSTELKQLIELLDGES